MLLRASKTRARRPRYMVRRLVFADEGGFLGGFVLLLQGAGDVAERSGIRGGRDFPQGAFAFGGGVGAGAQQALFVGHRSLAGVLGMTGLAQGLGLAVYHRAGGLAPGERSEKQAGQQKNSFHRTRLQIRRTPGLVSASDASTDPHRGNSRV